MKRESRATWNSEENKKFGAIIGWYTEHEIGLKGKVHELET